MRRFLTVAMMGVAALASPIASAEGQGDSGPTKQAVLTKAPKLVKFVEADYPPAEKAAGKTADVVMEIAISDKGIVQDVVIVKSAGPAFDAAAMKAARQFVFSPAEIDGKPAPVKITYKYQFVVKIEKVKISVVNFAGVVRDTSTKKPLPGITIKIGDFTTKTNEEGKFEFKDLPPGKQVVLISGPGISTIATEETIEEKKRLDVTYDLEGEKPEEVPEEDVEVVEVTATKLEKGAVSTEVSTEEARKIPGTQGDTLKVVQNLPGVARSGLGSGALVVWGAAPTDTRVYVDGVRVPQLYHVGGLRSTISSEIVRSIDLVPGGYGAEYGRGLGGLVTVDTRALRGDRVHGALSADIIDASGFIEVPLDKDTRVAVAARKSYLDRSISLVTSRDVSDVIPIPSYWDAQLVLERDLRAKETVRVMFLGAGDTLTRTVPSPDPAETRAQETSLGYGRLILGYKRQLDDGSLVNVTASGGLDRNKLVSRFGSTPTELSSNGSSWGFRAAYRGKVGTHLTIATGLDVEAQFMTLFRRGAVTIPPREGDVYVFGQPPPDQINADDWSTMIGGIAPWVSADISLFEDKLHIVPGFRVDAYVTSGDRLTPKKGDTPAIGFANEQTTLEPRLLVRYQATEKLAIKGAVGIYHQSPLAEDLSAVFGNPSLGIGKAVHTLVGVAYKWLEKTSTELTFFRSVSEGLTSRSASENPLLAQALVQEGEGRAYGAQVLVRQELAKGFFGWISYSIIRSERKDHPDSNWRLFDYDQTHIATLVAAYDLGRGFEVGMRLRYASGFPRTEVYGSYYDARRDLYSPYPPADKDGNRAVNTTRIPAFMQADVRLSKKWTLSEKVKMETFVDVQNVANTKNREEIVYDYAYRNKAYITGLPILPVFGARLEW
ncbi:MAG: TonB-dependent receptor domain-containing protein [Polyangiales bacterium]